MSDVRLIDANSLQSKLYSLLKMEGASPVFIEGLEFALAVADVATTINAVPVVRCRECVHNEDEDVCPFVRVNCGKNWLEIVKPHPDGFCHRGARIDGGADNG